MAQTDHDRFELHTRLRDVLGEKEADILMEHLPPSEWTDLARTSDLDRTTHLLRSDFRAEMSDLRGELKTEMADLRTELKTEMGGLRGELKTEMADLRTELKTEMADLRGELKTEMANLRGELKTEMGGLRTELKTQMADLRTDVKSEFHKQTWRYIGTTITLHAATIAAVGYLVASTR